MPRWKKPEVIRSVSGAASERLKSFKLKPKPSATASATEDVALKSYISSINISSLTRKSSNYLYNIEHDSASSTLTSDMASIQLDYDYQDSSHNMAVGQALDFRWSSVLSLNTTLSPKDASREKKKKWNSGQIHDIPFNRLVKLCRDKLGVDHTLKIYGKMVPGTRINEYKALLELHLEKARETDDPEVQIDQNLKAYQIFQSMIEMRFPIEEDIYGPFLKYLTDKDMVQEFYFFSDIFKHGKPVSLPRLAYYEMLLCIRLNNQDKIKRLIYDSSLYDGEDKHLFQESYLLALCKSDCKGELLMLLETFDVTKASSVERMSDIFKSLGMFSLESYAQKFLLELKTSGAKLATLANYIYDYAINIPNLAVEDVVVKFKQLHSEMEMKPTSTQYEKVINHCCKLLKVHVAVDLADEMFNVGSAASLETIHTMLYACMESYEYNMVHRIYSIIRRQGLKPNSETFRSLISLTVRLKDFNGAYDMLREMVEINIGPTISIYNTIMAGYFREKNIRGAMAVLKQMDKATVKPNSQTCSFIIRNCNSEEDIAKILDGMEQSKVGVTKHVFIALINALAACGGFEKAKQVILDPRIPVKNFNELRSVLVCALASHGQLSDALIIYGEIKRDERSLEPKAALYLIEHLQSEGQLDRLLQLQQELQDSDYFIDGCYRVVAYCFHHNHLSSAVDLLKRIRDKFADDEVAAENIFDEVFSEFVNQEPKDMKFGLELLRAIKEEIGLRPSRNVLDFLLDACVSASDLKTAFFIWKEYQVAGLPYNILSFLRMYRTLLALGDLKSAEEILKKIPQDDPHISHVIKGFQDTYLKSALLRRAKKKKKKKI